jgi:hypothetical protein
MPDVVSMALVHPDPLTTLDLSVLDTRAHLPALPAQGAGTGNVPITPPTTPQTGAQDVS